MRKPHYWKLAGASSAPSEMIVVDTETHYGRDTLTPSGEWHTLRLGCALAYRLERGKRTRTQRITFYKIEEFWELVRKRLSKSRPVWIVGHNLPYDLGILNGWKVICGEDYKHEKLCISGQMFYVKGYLNGCGLNFLDTVNYYHCSLARIGKSVGCPKMEMPTYDRPDTEWERYCANDVEVTARGIEAIIRFNREHSLGPFQPTIASSAFAAYRSSFMRSKVLVHCQWDALKLERDSYYGGIVETAYVGKVPETEIHELDVCSMYPSVCRNPLPTKIKGYSTKMGVEHIRKKAEQYLVFAEVNIKNTPVPYPSRNHNGTYYPCGTFKTSLAHPELMDAIDRGVVGYVHRVSWYEHAPIFREYMEFMVGNKIAYNKKGDEAFENVCKLYATNLYGKTGQVSPRWMAYGKDALQTLEQRNGMPEGTLEYWYTKPPDVYHYDPVIKIPELPHPIECRMDYGILEIKVDEHESRDSCPAIAATVTSYARVLMRKYMDTAGIRNWYYSDTDSIWVNSVGMSRLHNAGYIRPQTLGYLDHKKTHSHMIIHGPKDYETDLVCKRKGVRVNATPCDDGGWEQLQFPGALQQIRSGKEGGVMVSHITKHLHRNITRCKVGDSGYTTPLIYPVDDPERIRKEKRRVKGKR